MSKPLRVSLSGRTLRVVAEPVAPIGEVRIYSDRNAKIPRATDPSPREPHPESWARRPFNRNVAYPVVDVKVVHGMRAVLTATHVLDGSYTVNPMYNAVCPSPTSDRMEIPAIRLEPWENWFCFNDPGLTPCEFYLSLPVGSHGLDTELETLSDSWSGRVELVEETPDGLHRTVESVQVESAATAAESLAPRATRKPITAGDGDPPDRALLLEGLRFATGYLLRSQERSKASGASGSAYLLYDYDARTFRQKNWFWTLGPAIRALLGTAAVPELLEEFSGASESALRMGQATTRRTPADPSHPAFGIPVTRFDTEREGRDYEAKYSPSDALFLASWGWLPLYQATGDAGFLRATRDLVRAAARLIDREVVITQDYYEQHGAWNDWTMNEAGFGMEGIADLYLETREPWVLETGRKYIEQLIELFETPEGLWHRHFFRHDRAVNPADSATRGMGWAMEGLTAAYRMGLGDTYLEKARQMAEHLLAHQRTDGCWGVIFTDKPGSDAGDDDKGTPLWSVLFYRMYRLTGDERYLRSARAALSWCISQLSTGPDPDGVGGMPTTTPSGGVIYWPRYRVSCLYSVAFAAIAMEEELGVQEIT